MLRFSRSRSSNRTGGFPASGSRARSVTALPTDMRLRDAAELVQAQFRVQIRVREACVSLSPYLVLLAEPPTEPTPSVLQHDLVGGYYCPHAEVARPAPQLLVQVGDHFSHVLRGRASVGAF